MVTLYFIWFLRMPISGKMYVWGEKAKHVPPESGIYAFYNERGSLIYLGGSSNLQETFLNYLATNVSDDIGKPDTRYYRRELSSEWEERLKALLHEYKTEHGELPPLNSTPEVIQKEVSRAWGFYFYEAVGKPVYEAAFNLGDFSEKIKKVPVASLEFHQERGDFSKWIHAVFKETQLAERIAGIFTKGEDLRRDLLNALRNPEIEACPKCGLPSGFVKSWKMAGRPSKKGERLQLTIALFRCDNCKKTFRKVAKKEKIRR